MHLSTAVPLQFLFRLTLGWKLVATAVVCALPIAMLGLLYLAQIWKDVSFTRKELFGTAYLMKAWPIFMSTAQTVGTLKGVGSTERAVMQTAGRRFDAAAGTARETAAFLAAAQQGKGALEALALGQTAIRKIGGGSNLMFDPDVDTYYLMDVVVLRIPELIGAAHSVHTSVAVLARNPAPTFDDKARLILATGRLDAATTALARAYEAAFDPGASASVRAALAPRVAANSSVIRAFRDAVETTARHSADGTSLATDLPLVADSYANLLADADKLWVASGTRLSHMLEERIAGYFAIAMTRLGAVGVVLALAAGLLFLVTQSIQLPIRDLIAAMGRLRDGDTTFMTPHVEQANE